MLLGPHWTHPRSSSISMPDPATDFAALFSPTTPRPSHQSRRAEQPSGLNLHQRIYRPHLYQEPPVLEPLSFSSPSPLAFTRSQHPLPLPTITFRRLRRSHDRSPHTLSPSDEFSFPLVPLSLSDPPLCASSLSLSLSLCSTHRSQLASFSLLLLHQNPFAVLHPSDPRLTEPLLYREKGVTSTHLGTKVSSHGWQDKVQG